MKQAFSEFPVIIEGATEKLNKYLKPVSQNWVKPEPLTCNLIQKLNVLYLNNYRKISTIIFKKYFLTFSELTSINSN